MQQSHAKYHIIENNECSSKVMFPLVREVLWNRSPLCNPFSINFTEPFKKWNLIIDYRTLNIAYKQLHIHGNNFSGFFIGDIVSQSNGPLLIHVDRFDPGRDGQVTIEGVSKNVRLPTSTLPGNICIPVNLCHKSYNNCESQLHSFIDFEASILSIKSWLSRKEKLDASNLVSMKMKCLFFSEENKIQVLISCSCITFADTFSVQSISSIPVIQTALARNLCGTLGDKYTHVQTGFITMDQTRKLLLLVETDPKVYLLPLVGVWLSGVDVTDHLVLASILRFIYSKHIIERVSVPTCTYLLVLFPAHSVEPKFFEFFQVNAGNTFHLLEFFENVNIELHKNTTESEYHFELKLSKSGLDAGNLSETLSDFNAITEENMVGKLHQNYSLDDSLPSLSPVPHILQIKQSVTPSVPDLSLCDSSVNEEHKNEAPESSPSTLESQPTCDKSFIDRRLTMLPRQTKASLARITMSKNPKAVSKMATDKKHNLAIKFKNIDTKKNETINFHVQKNKVLEADTSVLQHDDSVKLPLNFFSNTSHKTKNIEHSSSLPSLNTLDKTTYATTPYTTTHTPLNTLDKITYTTTHTSSLNTLDKTTYATTPYTGKNVEYTSKNYVNLEDDKSFIFDDKNKSFAEPKNINKNYSQNEGFQDPRCFADSNSDDRSQNNFKTQSITQNLNNSKINSLIDDKNIPDYLNYHNGYKQDNDLLLELVLSQQKQLADLQSQLTLFLNNEKSQKVAEKNNSVDETIKAVQIKQQEQLDDLQKKLQLFLDSALSKSTSSIENIGVQCNMVSPEKISTATNTGSSLLCEEATTTNNTKKNICPHCCSCSRKKGLRHSHSIGKRNSLQNNDSIFLSADLSDLKKDDIQIALNNTGTSGVTLASSLQAVDLPVFDDGQDSCVSQNSDEWNRSPMLGESASMLIDQQNQLNAVKKQVDNVIENDTASYNNHFYSQMMEHVKQMMCAQNISVSSSNSDDASDSNKVLLSTTSPKVNMVKTVTSSSIDTIKLATPTNNTVKLATEAQLQKIINQPFEVRMQSISTGAVYNHPKINYHSMSVDETLSEYSQNNIDVIAAKYLPVTDLRAELRNKTVTFEGVVESNTTSVNFSCNMSIASKRYLQRYQLNDEKNGDFITKPIVRPSVDANETVSREIKKSRDGKENILDMKKIRNLPKLI
ncbi:SCL-interrupting locus protein homolog isoform X9 [Hydra vulgaris]|uniref:SCL-interrupting locus protein homolog isoform X9 n=2 Tax=Hydra vulgaris TaxID=6087 RepID=A0ABM4B7Q8_HYDVU